MCRVKAVLAVVVLAGGGSLEGGATQGAQALSARLAVLSRTAAQRRRVAAGVCGAVMLRSMPQLPEPV